jgi:hypothetical protein
MNRFAIRARTSLSVAAVMLATVSFAAPFAVAAGGSSVPFTDTSIRGTLTFCSRTGQPMTSGSLFTAPFAWKTVSSAPAPTGYRGSRARVTLYAYQPIQFVDPGDWSGQQLTGASAFSNAAHPVVQATNIDSALLGFSNAFPAHWDGTVELRMYYTAFNREIHSQSYPAAVIRITGSTWTLLSGGGSSCSAGKGVSDESILLPKARLATPHAAVPTGSASPVVSASKPSTGNGSAAQVGNRGSAGGSAQAAQADQASEVADSSGLGSGTKAGVGLGVVAAVGLGALGVFWWRRRPGAGS